MNEKAWQTEIAELRALQEQAPQRKAQPLQRDPNKSLQGRSAEAPRWGRRLPWQGPVLVTDLGVK